MTYEIGGVGESLIFGFSLEFDFVTMSYFCHRETPADIIIRSSRNSRAGSLAAILQNEANKVHRMNNLIIGF